MWGAGWFRELRRGRQFRGDGALTWQSGLHLPQPKDLRGAQRMSGSEEEVSGWASMARRVQGGGLAVFRCLWIGWTTNRRLHLGERASRILGCTHVADTMRHCALMREIVSRALLDRPRGGIRRGPP